MGLFQECGNGWVPVKIAKKEMGLDAYLVCPGPSMVPIERGRGRLVMAVNTAYPKVIPDIWVGMDKVECYDRRLWGESFMKILRGNYGDLEFKGKAIKYYPQTYFASVSKSGKSMFDLRGHTDKFVWNKHTLGVALNILIWMGAKRIHFVGCDLGGDKDYYDDRVLSEGLRTYNRRLYDQQVTFLQKHTEEGAKRGIELISCTPDSPINRYMEYIPVEKAIEATEARVEYEEEAIFHVKELGGLKDIKIVGYYTPKYKDEAVGLKRSLDRLGLEYDIEPVPDLGSWDANTKYKAHFIRGKLDKYDRILYVDVDARFRSIPYDLIAYTCDVAVRFEDFPWRKNECLSGTVYMKSNEKTKKLCDRWIEVNTENKRGLEQWNLGEVIKDMELDVKDLPAEYVFIFDHMKKKYPKATPVIEHFQASRRLK